MITRYRPKLAELTQQEIVDSIDMGFEDFDPYEGLGAAFQFIARTTEGSGYPLLTRHIIDMAPIEELGEFEITYSFPDTPRPNIFYRTNKRSGELAKRAYGTNISMRMLYEVLCNGSQVGNNGEYFIDAYFERVFETRPVYDDFASMRDEIRAEMLNELKQMRRAAGRRLSSASPERGGSFRADYGRIKQEGWKSFAVWRTGIHRRKVAQIARDIREDIIGCLYRGEIPMSRAALSDSTIAEKEAFGFDSPQAIFYASGQLIHSLQVYVNLEKEAA